MDWIAIGVSVGAPALVGLVTYFGARKLGLTQAQQSLVATLQSQVGALDRDLARIKDSEASCKRELERQEHEISDLRDEVWELRTRITKEVTKTQRTGPVPRRRGSRE